ncbi:MAG: hypothetical protein QM757_29445 [Paludibaculum sp.]
METVIAAKRLTKGRIAAGVGCVLASFLLPMNSGLRPLIFFVGICLLVTKARGQLRLDDNGFTFGNGVLGDKTIRWAEVGTFKVITFYAAGFIPTRRMVGWTTHPNKQRSVAMKAVGWLAGFDGSLPHSYGMRAAELAAVLEQWRQRSVEVEAAQQREALSRPFANRPSVPR